MTPFLLTSSFPGYSREEVVGRNCRFLQGPETDQDIVREMREAIDAEKPCTVRLLNYRKDGTPFWNNLHVSPIRNACGKVGGFRGFRVQGCEAFVGLSAAVLGLRFDCCWL
jgi:PAS domain S-box-containing protein